MDSVLFSKKSDDWATPKDFYDLMIYGMDAFDPCPLHSVLDGLSLPTWGRLAYVNPPYSCISKWVDKALNEHYERRTDVILLLPARTDTKWFYKLFRAECCCFIFLKGRLKFGESLNSAPFPSVLVVMGCKDEYINKFDVRSSLPNGYDFNDFFGCFYYED